MIPLPGGGCIACAAIGGMDPKAEAAGFGMSPYCAMGNNPISQVDPDGDLPFLALVAIGAATGVFSNGLSNVSNGQNFFTGAGEAALWGGVGAAVSFGVGAAFGDLGSIPHELLRAGAHAFTQGGLSAAQGSSFRQGAYSGGLGSLIGSTGVNPIIGGGVGGGFGSLMAGGNFWQGFGQGIAVGAFNHYLHGGLNGDPNKKGKSGGHKIASAANDVTGTAASAAEAIGGMKVKGRFESYEEFLRSQRLGRRIKAIGKAVGKYTGIIGIADALYEVYNDPNNVGGYVKLTVNVGTAVLTKNPAVGIAVGIADITGLSDFIYSKF